MWPFNSKKKLDPHLKSFSKLTSRNKIPGVLTYRGNIKTIKSKLSYSGVKILFEHSLIECLAVLIPISAIEKISTFPEITSIYYDWEATLCITRASKSLGISSSNQNITGRDVTVGIIDSGVFPHKGLTSKENTIKYFNDILYEGTSPYDDYGHGTYLSGIIASNFDYAKGIAPDASLSVVKAFDKSGKSNLSSILKAIETLYIECPDIKILLLPFEIKNMPSLRVDPLYNIISLLYSKNITIIAPSGNSGPAPFTISPPGLYKEVLTVGGCKYENNDFKISEFSSRGPLKEDYIKPDIVSISEGIISLKSDVFYKPKTRLIEKETIETTSFAGTSVSCAVVAGMCALIIERYGELTPKDIKSILYLGCKSIGENKNIQGKGVVLFNNLIKDKEKAKK